MRRNTFVMIVAGVFVLAVVFIGGAQVSAQTPTANDVNEVAKELFCPLCTGVTVDVCQTQQCAQMRSLIAEKLAAGETKDQIKQYFVQQYGQTVLGTPAKKGLGLTVWILPFVALLFGLGWGAYVLRKWSVNRNGQSALAEANLEAIPDKYHQQLERELQESE